MEYQDRVTMAISDWTNYIDDNDIEFAFGKVDFISNRDNSHKHIYSEEVLKQYAPTVLGKWVIADYNKYTNDVTTHTDNEVIVGYVPTSQEVSYRYDVYGYLIASVDVIISKLYATNVYEMFKQKNYKSVSIEELVNFTEETRDFTDGIQEKVVESFCVCGITILGDNYNPSVPNANIQLTKMSDEESNKQIIENAYITYSEKHRDNSVDKIDIVLSKLESIEKKLNKEELMSKDSEVKEVLNSTDEQVEEVVNAEEQNSEEQAEATVAENETVEVENAETEEDKTEDTECEENACGEEATENACGDEEVENAEDEDAESEDVECEQCKVENADIEMSELKTKLSEAEAKIANYESELAELRTFKESVQNSEKLNIANQTLNKVKDFITTEDYAEYQKQFEECTYEEVGALKNSILAKYVDAIIEKSQETKNEETEIVDYGIPVDNANKVESIYD